MLYVGAHCYRNFKKYNENQKKSFNDDTLRLYLRRFETNKFWLLFSEKFFPAYRLHAIIKKQFPWKLPFLPVLVDGCIQNIEQWSAIDDDNTVSFVRTLKEPIQLYRQCQIASATESARSSRMAVSYTSDKKNCAGRISRDNRFDRSTNNSFWISRTFFAKINNTISLIRSVVRKPRIRCRFARVVCSPFLRNVLFVRRTHVSDYGTGSFVITVRGRVGQTVIYYAFRYRPGDGASCIGRSCMFWRP